MKNIKNAKFLMYLIPLLVGFLMAQGVQANDPTLGTSTDPLASASYLETAWQEKLAPLEAELKELKAELEALKLPFTDIDSSEVWAREQILYLYHNNIISGRGDKTFDPQATLTRVEFAKMSLLAATYEPMEVTVSRFKDVPSDPYQSWQIGYVESSAENGLIKGDNLGYFKPINAIKREEMAAILVRAMGLEEEAQQRTNEEVPFADGSEISSWARGYVIIAKEKGIINGIPLADGSFKFAPAKNATRQEAAKIIYEYVSKNK